MNVSHVVLPLHRTAKTQSLLLPLSCHTLFLASMNVCLVYICANQTYFHHLAIHRPAQIKYPITVVTCKHFDGHG